MMALISIIKVLIINKFGVFFRAIYKLCQNRPNVLVSPAYESALTHSILFAVGSDRIGNAFREQTELPSKYGFRLSERIIEIPWFFHNFDSHKGIHLDLGASLNFLPYIGLLKNKTDSIIVSNLNAERDCHWMHEVSYIYADSRKELLKENVLDSVSCISVLEHVGMDNTRYTSAANYKEANNEDYLQVIKEIRRMLKLGGFCYLTIPYGKYVNHHWLQVFDKERIARIMETFKPTHYSESYYLYSEDGWQVSSGESCKDAKYSDEYKYPLFQVGAGAVVCLKLQK